MKKSRVRTLSIAVSLLLVFIVVGIGLGTFYLKALEETVTAKFEGRKWRFPSKIYSDSFLFYVGMNLRMEDLAGKLRRLGYRESRDGSKARGEYRFLQREGVLEIYLHDFVYPFESFKGSPVRMVLRGNTVYKIENLSNGEELFSLELEP